ncbi:MAG TPA: hypothetical protein VGB50_02090 [Flavobacterium sp.]|jgi:hypothetical protein
MKRILFLLFIAFALVPMALSAQSSTALQSATKNFYEAMYNIDIDAISNMLCHDKTDVYERVDNAFQNDDFKYRFVFTNAKFDYSAIKNINAKSYAVVNFRNTVRVTSYKPLTSSQIAETQKRLKEKFGAKSILYEKNRNSFFIVYQAKLIAEAETGKSWKFIIYDNTLPKEISESCLSNSLKKELQLN